MIFTAETGDKPARFNRRLELEMALGGLVHKPVQVVDLNQLRSFCDTRSGNTAG